MTLEFESGIIPDSLCQELGFQDYLNLFELELPLIPHLIMRPLEQKDAGLHFQKLSELEAQMVRHDADLSQIVLQCKKLPGVDYLLPFFESQQLEPYHLYDLGRFVQTEIELTSMEECIPLPDKSAPCLKILEKLLQFISNDFSSLKLTSTEKELQQTINRLNDQIAGELSQYEQQLYQETGLKLVYPFPKEIDKHAEELDRIKNCKLVKLVEKSGNYLLEYILTGTIENLVEKKNRLQQTWEHQIQQKINQLNQELQSYFQEFLDHYQQRKKRCIDYSLLFIKREYGFCLPRFNNDSGIELKTGVLPILKKQGPEFYKPLDIHLHKGVNVLFGANMTGKTTVLKTLYFHLTLIKFGLPVPATSIALGFPAQIAIHLRSSGQIRSGLSGFGEEIRFFCKQSQQPSIYLIDELFHSTDPVNGAKLSEAFLTGLAGSDSVFLCTSHYPEVLSLPGIAFFKMKDTEHDPEQEDIDTLLKQVPFVVEPLAAGSPAGALTHSNKPLQIALRFPLPETIKQNIRKKLET